MTDRRGSYDFIYVHTDIPEGMTIREWRAQRAVEREAQRRQERAARRERVSALLTPRIAAAKCARRRGSSSLATAIRGPGYARTAGPQASLFLRTCVRRHDA